MSKSTTKKTATKAVKTEVKPFTPKEGIPNLSRGREFLALRKQGKSVAQIVAIYKKAGIKKVGAPTVYNAIKLVEAPKFVQEALAAGTITASEATQLVKPLRATSGARKGRMVEESQEDFVARVKSSLEELTAEREARRATLAKAGFVSEGTPKFTKSRTLSIVVNNLRSLKGSLKNPRIAALVEFEKALANGATVDELVALAKGK
jgi:polyhydroxyalkanoate synthesis regulator phasin